MKNFAKWKSFDFGPETSVDEKPVLKKRKSFDQAQSTHSKYHSPLGALRRDNFDFYKRIEPKDTAELIVHPKKILEIEGWLKSVAETPCQQRTQFLLLTGPAGSGKSLTVQVLCKSINIETTEWVNPVDIDYEVFKGPGQMKSFLDFFNEAKYCSLFTKESRKKVLIVKDFPNALVRNPEEFPSVLEDISYKSTNPVIFICTDSSSSDVNLQKSLFSDEILIKYSITHISFNSCASSLLKKGLKRAVGILQAYPELFQTPSQSTIESVIASSMGDIRCAMNQLYLTCIIGSEDIPVVKSKLEKPGNKRKRSDQISTIKHMVRDETLGLFHGLGRVLNPKRREEGESWRLNCDVQKLVDEFSIQPTRFTSFLFENYLKYFGDINDVEKSADILSFSTLLLENWNNHDTLIIALWIGVLGLMTFNEHKVSKWNQIKAPRKVTKVQFVNDKLMHPTDRFYYNVITKTEKYHQFS